MLWSPQARFVGLALALSALGACSDGAPPATVPDTGAPPQDVPADLAPQDIPGDTGSDTAADTTTGDQGPTDSPLDTPGDASRLCATSADCAGHELGFRVCDPSTGRCVECVTGMDSCPTGQFCDDASQRCVPGCSTDAHCAGAGVDGGAPRARCNTLTRACVECVTNDHCVVGTWCSAGRCVPGCDPSRGCPSGQTCCSESCVTTSTSVTHCGACGNACAVTHGTPACVGGACSVAACEAPWADCDGMASNGCEVNAATSASHCGRCGNACPTAHSTAACTGGACAIAACEAPWSDCDGVASNGCEVNPTEDVRHCGRCGNACPAPAHATATCAAGACGVRCETGFADCDGSAANGCETDTRTSASHCGACGRVCASEHSTPACAAGACAVGACEAGYGDCDGGVSNGCERNLLTDPSHCGVCGTVCGAGTVCSSGACLSTCRAGLSWCSGVCADLTSDTAHCGACGTACPDQPGSSPVCASSRCGIRCDPGRADCNGVSADGCEVDLQADESHCGACGTACPTRPNAGVRCASGVCASECTSGWGDCNGVSADGCETDVRSAADHCGACRASCPAVTHGVSACSAGACGLGRCDTGFGDCDRTLSNGCETDLRTSAMHCGACGAACAAGSYCVAGACVACGTCGTGPDGDFAPTASRTLAGGTYRFRSVTIPAGVTVTVTGPTPLRVYSRGAVRIGGTLELSGQPGNLGVAHTCGCSVARIPGGAGGGGGGGAGGEGGGYDLSGYTAITFGTAGSGAGGGAAGEGNWIGGAGGGGGYATSGTRGGVSTCCSARCTSEFTLMGGAGGGAQGTPDLATFAGGSGGGGGGFGGADNGEGGSGGGGGGAVLIIAPSIQLSGTIRANGGAGGNEEAGRDGGPGGGGSGGAIWLQTGALEHTGRIEANGGAGGTATVGSSCGSPGAGGQGAPGRVRLDVGTLTGTGTTSPAAFRGTLTCGGPPCE